MQPVSTISSTNLVGSSILERLFTHHSLSFLLLITLPGWVIAWATEQVLIGDLASIWGAFIALGWLWSRVGRPLEMVRFVRIGAACLCGIQNVSWLIASFIHKFSLDISIETSLAQSMRGGLTFRSYALAIIFASIFSIVLSHIGSRLGLFQLEKKACLLLLKLRSVSITRLSSIVLALILAEIGLISAGVIGQRTLLVDGYDKGELPAWFVFYETLLPAQILLNALVFLYLWRKRTSFMKNKWAWCIVIISFSIILFINFTKGRSAMVFATMAHGYWGAFFVAAKPRLIKVLLIGVVVYPLLSQILVFNNFLRGSGAEFFDQSKNIVDMLPEMWDRFESTTSLIEENKRSKENLATRPLVAIPLAMCMELPASQKSFMMGENLLNAVIWAIPGPLISNKKDYATQEDLLYAHFPIGDKDTADSLYLSAYTEFWWIGLLIYPVFVMLLWALVLSLIVSFSPSNIVLIIAVSVFLQFFSLGIGEGAINGWLVTLRSVFFWFLLDRIWKFYLPKRTKNSKPVSTLLLK